MPSLFELLFHQTPRAALLVEAGTLSVSAANTAAGLLFHLEPAEICGQGLASLCAPGEFERLNASIGRGRGTHTLSLDLLCAEDMPFRAKLQAELPENSGTENGQWLIFIQDLVPGHGHATVPRRLSPVRPKPASNLEQRLRQAVEAKEFVLHYQPKYNLRNGKLAGAEALVRWNRPGEGLVMPDRFIPLAEQSSLILPLGEWVLNESCRQAKLWEGQGVKMSVNLSPVQLRQGTLTSIVDKALRDSGVSPGSIELEITETAAMQNPGHSLAVLRALTQRGLLLALDDFGKGYSSLNYLKQFPVNTLKIDLSFIRDILSEPKDAAIVRAIIILGHNLEMNVLAEGVELEAEAAFLKSKHCDLAQGYLYSRPVPAETFEKSFFSR